MVVVDNLIVYSWLAYFFLWGSWKTECIRIHKSTLLWVSPNGSHRGLYYLIMSGLGFPICNDRVLKYLRIILASFCFLESSFGDSSRRAQLLVKPLTEDRSSSIGDGLHLPPFVQLWEGRSWRGAAGVVREGGANLASQISWISPGDQGVTDCNQITLASYPFPLETPLTLSPVLLHGLHCCFFLLSCLLLMLGFALLRANGFFITFAPFSD